MSRLGQGGAAAGTGGTPGGNSGDSGGCALAHDEPSSHAFFAGLLALALAALGRRRARD